MKILNHLMLVAICAASLISCKTQYELLLEGTDFEGKYSAAFDLFNQGKYTKAAQLFESLSSTSGNLPQDDTVHYYWGLSNYLFKDYFTAETNFTNFVLNYPLSAFAEDARYYRIDCLFRETLRYELDQKPTKTAISAMTEYIKDYPDSPYRSECERMLAELEQRLDRKAYENARLYYKMEDYKAATVALKNVLKDDSDNFYREDVLYHIAMSSYKYAALSVDNKQKERYLVFLDDYLNFVGEYPESSYRRELDGLYKRVQSYLGRGVVVTQSDVEQEEESGIEK